MSNQIAQNNYVINYRDFEKGFPAIFKTNLIIFFLKKELKYQKFHLIFHQSLRFRENIKN